MAFDYSTASISSITQSVTETASGATKYFDAGLKIPTIEQMASVAGINRVMGPATAINTDPLDNYKVKLISATDLYNKNPQNIERVVFNVSPTVNEDRSVEYSQVSPIHMPGSMQVYKRTSSRSFSVSAPLISRTRAEATDNMKILQRLRGWTMPYFGNGSRTGSYSDPKGDGSNVRTAAELVGAPPDVLYFYAYSSTTSRKSDSHVNLNRIPVVISQLGIAYPDDVDYIPTMQSNKEPMPVKMLVTFTLLETHSPYEYEQFSLQDFKAGRLKNF